MTEQKSSTARTILVITAIAAFAAIGVTALLVNIMEHKQEARNPFFRVVELDDDTEEDLLALSREFDLHGLIEDELLMSLPVVPRHGVCPEPVPMKVADEDFEAASAEKPNPFAALAGLRGPKAGN